MCTRGGVVVSSALPSLVTVQIAPVSATRKLAPEMPTSAERNLLAQLAPRALRPWRPGPRSCGGRCRALNSTDTCSRVRCIAGQTMCDGRVAGELDDVLGEVGLDALDAGLGQRVRQADLLAQHRLDTGHAPGARPRGRARRRCATGLARRRGPVHPGARGDGVALELDQVVVEVGDHVVLDRLAALARRLELREVRQRRGALALGGAGGAVDRDLERAVGQRRVGARLEARVPARTASALLADRRAVGHAGQHLDRVEAAHRGAAAVQLARHVHQAAEVAAQQQLGAGALDRLRLLLDDRVRDRRDT